MNYQEAIDYIHGVDKFGMVLGLDSIRALLKRLGNPQNKLKIIHVAGTNGKGSTSSFISNILIRSGYKVGLYTSPFLEKFNERIRLDGENIEDEKLAEIVEKVKISVDSMISDGLNHPTEFEIVTAVAFCYYEREKVDFLVLEVGLGGRFDATNVIDESLVSVITSISIDHTAVLGNTIEKIAFEKAGIIKEGGSVLIYNQDERALNVVFDEASKKDASVIISKTTDLQIKKSNLNNQVFSFRNTNDELMEDLKIRLIGEHQINNCILAINTAIFLRDKFELNITNESIYDGVLNTKWPGRLEVISEKPLFIIDGAHNLDSAMLLSKEIDRLIGEDYEKTLILGLLSDKDVDGIIKLLTPKFDRVVITKPNNTRAMNVEDLAYRVGMYVDDIICIEDIDESVEHVYRVLDSLKKNNLNDKNIKSSKNNKSKKKDKNYLKNNNKNKKQVVVSAGSLYLIGQVRSYVNSKNV